MIGKNVIKLRLPGRWAFEPPQDGGRAVFWAIALCLLSCIAVVPRALADDEYDACIQNSGGTNPEWADCGAEWIDREDRRLNAAWTLLTPKLEPDTKKALLDEQRAWIAYKDKSCLLYADGTFGQEGSTLEYPACRVGVIAQRSIELRAIGKYVDGPQ